MSIKAIALIRTSTTQQEIDSQRDQVLEMCYNDGLREDEVIIVGKQGASAIKVDDAYLENMKKVYELLENTPSIKTVYAWAIDRIGRTREHLSKFREVLLKKKIQLIIKTPYLKLLNEDGSENVGVGIAFSIFIEMAIQEMQQKVERFKRAKERNRKHGKYNGSPHWLYGYRVDENGYYVIDEVDSKNVREIFEEYATGKYSLNTLTHEMYLRGAKKSNMNKLPLTTIRTVLYNWQKYCGEDDYINYPQIISKKLAHKVKDKLTANKFIQRSKTHHYFGHGIMRCFCGTRLRYNGTHYQCVAKKNDLGKLIGESNKCQLQNNNIQGSVLDGILFQVAMDCYEINIKELTTEKKKELSKELSVIDCKIKNIENNIRNFDTKRKKLLSTYVLEDLDEYELISLRKKIDKQEKSIKSQLNNLYEQRETIRGALGLGYNKILNDWNEKVHLAEVSYKADEVTMNGLVKKFIKSGTLGKFEGDIEGWNFKKIIEIKLKTLYGERTFVYLPHVREKRVVYELFNDGSKKVFGFDEIVRGSKGEMNRIFREDEVVIKIKKRVGSPMSGKKHKEETRKKMSEIRRGYKKFWIDENDHSKGFRYKKGSH